MRCVDVVCGKELPAAAHEAHEVPLPFIAGGRTLWAETQHIWQKKDGGGVLMPSPYLFAE